MAHKLTINPAPAQFKVTSAGELHVQVPLPIEINRSYGYAFNIPLEEEEREAMEAVYEATVKNVSLYPNSFKKYACCVIFPGGKTLFVRTYCDCCGSETVNSFKPEEEILKNIASVMVRYL